MNHERGGRPPELEAAEAAEPAVVEQPREEKPDTPHERITLGYRRHLQEMREELKEGGLERAREAGMKIDAVQEAVAKFYADFVENGREFYDAPWEWAAKMREAGRAEEIMARAEGIDAMLLEVPKERDLPRGDASAWLLRDKRHFLSEIRYDFKDSLEKILRKDGSGNFRALRIINQYGQATFPERMTGQQDYYVESQEAVEQMKPFYPWTASYLKTMPTWMTSGISKVALFRKEDRSTNDRRACLGGNYNESERRMRLSALADAQVVAHEVAHAIDFDANKLNKLDAASRAIFLEAALEEEASHSLYVREKMAEDGVLSGIEEDFADSWSYFFTSPEYLQGLTPRRHTAMGEITHRLGLDVEAMRQAAQQAESERVGNPDLARTVFENYGWSMMNMQHKLPVTYTETRWALADWQRLETTCHMVDSDRSESVIDVIRDERGRLLSQRANEQVTFEEPVYDDRDRLTAYRSRGHRYEVRYGDGDMPEQVLTVDNGEMRVAATFRMEAGRVVQTPVAAGEAAWDFSYELDETGHITEVTAALAGKPICRRPVTKDAQGRPLQANYQTMEGKKPPGDNLTYVYAE